MPLTKVHRCSRSPRRLDLDQRTVLVHAQTSATLFCCLFTTLYTLASIMPNGDSGSTDPQLASNAPSGATEPASRLPPVAQAPPLSLASDDLRQLVLDYLSHSCFIDSALAFSKEWEQADGAASSNSSFYGSSDAGPSAGPSTIRGEAASSTSSAVHAREADDEQERDECEDDMMQSVHGTFNSHTASGSNGFGVSAENGDSATAYQDRHPQFSGNKHLTSEQVEQIRARKGK